MVGNINSYTENENVVIEDYDNIRYFRPKLKKRRRKQKVCFLRFFVSLTVLILMMVCIMPKSFFILKRSIFDVTPYKYINYNYSKLVFPTVSYFSNSWFLGNRFFKFENRSTPQMMELKETVSMPVLESGIYNLMRDYPQIRPVVYVWDYETQNYVDINASKVNSVASIIKIPILVEVFKSIEAGQFSLNDSLILKEYYRTGGSGKLQFNAANSIYSVDELANRMITDSDNSATNMLVSKVGSMEDVNSAIRNWGLRNTQINKWLPDLSGENYSTAREIARIFYNIDLNTEFLSVNSRSVMMNYMAHVHNDRLIQAGLGKKAVFLHKTGDISSMLGDAGIVIAPNGKKYIVVIFANRPHNSYIAKEFIVNVSQFIYDYMVK